MTRSWLRGGRSPRHAGQRVLHRRAQAESYAPFPILTDFDNGYALSLNLAFWGGAEMQEMMCRAGWDVSPRQGSDTWLLPVPATFVVDPKAW